MPTMLSDGPVMKVMEETIVELSARIVLKSYVHSQKLCMGSLSNGLVKYTEWSICCVRYLV